MNNKQQFLFLGIGFVMVLNSLLSILAISDTIDGLLAWNAITGHYWVMLITGVLFCLVPVLQDKEESDNAKLARMAADLKRLKRENT